MHRPSASANVQAAQAGPYQVRVSNVAGTVTSGAAALAVVVAPPPPPPPTIDLTVALDGPGLQWATNGDAQWTVQTGVTHDGVDAAQRGAITHDQASRLEATVTGPATLSFWWKVDSEQGFDFFSVEVDGAAFRKLRTQICGPPCSLVGPVLTVVGVWRIARR